MQREPSKNSEEVQKALDAIQEGAELYCPNCKNNYIPNIPNRAAAKFSGTQTDIQQWTSGLCSDKCWCEFIIHGEEEDTIYF